MSKEKPLCEHVIDLASGKILTIYINFFVCASFDPSIPFLGIHHINALTELFKLHYIFIKVSSCSLMKEESRLDLVKLDLSFTSFY